MAPFITCVCVCVLVCVEFVCVCEWALLGSVMIDSWCRSCGWPENEKKSFSLVAPTNCFYNFPLVPSAPTKSLQLPNYKCLACVLQKDKWSLPAVIHYR